MVVVKVEMWPGGVEAKRWELARMYIGRDETVDLTHANYNVALMRRGEERAPWPIGYGGNETANPIRTGRVENHNGQAYHVLRLVLKAIRSIYPKW